MPHTILGSENHELSQYICALFVHSTWPIVSSIMNTRTKMYKVKRWKCYVSAHSLVGTEMGMWHSRFSLVDNIPWPRTPTREDTLRSPAEDMDDVTSDVTSCSTAAVETVGSQ